MRNSEKLTDFWNETVKIKDKYLSFTNAELKLNGLPFIRREFPAIIVEAGDILNITWVIKFEK